MLEGNREKEVGHTQLASHRPPARLPAAPQQPPGSQGHSPAAPPPAPPAARPPRARASQDLASPRHRPPDSPLRGSPPRPDPGRGGSAHARRRRRPSLRQLRLPRQRLETTWKPRPAQDDEVAIVGASRRRGSHRHAPSGVNRSRHGPAAWGPGGGALGAALLPSGDAQQGCPGAGAGGSAGPAASWKRWAPRSPQRGGIPKAWEDSHSAGAGAGVEAAAILGEWTVQAGQVALRQKDAPPSPGGPSSAWETSLSLVS